MARYGCTITVAATKIPSSQSNFVWLATEDNFPTAAIDGGATSILNGGGNLRCYTDPTKTTQLPIEVVSFVTGGTPQVQVWGLSPTLTVGSTVYIEADTVATTQPAVTDTYGRNAVWTNYDWVTHDGGLTDSTGETFIDDGSGSVTTSPIGDALTAPRQRLSDIATGDRTSNFTLQVWHNGTDNGTLLSRRDGSDHQYALGVFSGNYFLNTTGNTSDTAVTSVSSGWQWISISFNDASDIDFYKNGSFVSNLNRTSITSKNYPTRIGYRGNGGLGTIGFAYAGLEAEARQRIGVTSADYTAAEYNNINEPSTFWTTSAWEDQDAAGGVTGDVAITINSPSFSVSGSATLPSPMGDIAFSIDKPVFNASGDATLPQPSGDISITVNAPTFNAIGSATVPFPQGNIAFTIASPLFSATGSATQPSPSGDITLVIAKPEFSATGSATLPNPTGDVDFTIDKQTFSATGSASLPYPVGNASITIAEPLFSASGSATLPQPSGTIAFDINEPVFYATGTVSGLVVPVGIALTPAFGSNVLKLQASSNIIKL